ncbi:hypothetical protein GcM3_03536 [Golovinomyces cichoracearum]|uniref:Secreted protein n=1 Tax=Golovinomyces cichoracearum TaxID=62708 RepID=A0A420IZF0_9PEZI|nr:hypothetical protein GcM3_03536 [Golovinomyces cichoracearum]
MVFTASDILKIILAVILPPLGVLLEANDIGLHSWNYSCTLYHSKVLKNQRPKLIDRTSWPHSISPFFFVRGLLYNK